MYWVIQSLISLEICLSELGKYTKSSRYYTICKKKGVYKTVIALARVNVTKPLKSSPLWRPPKASYS